MELRESELVLHAVHRAMQENEPIPDYTSKLLTKLVTFRPRKSGQNT